MRCARDGDFGARRFCMRGASPRGAPGAPLKPYRKLITSGGWSRCVKIRGGAGLGGLGLLPRYGGGAYWAEGSRGGTVGAGGP